MEKFGDVINIRPHQVLSIEDFLEDRITFFLPPKSGLGLSSIELILLIKLMRVVNASYVFEFGTHRGYTTRVLLENLPEKKLKDKRVYTIDLEDLSGVSFQGSDLKVAQQALGFERVYLKSPLKNMVEQLLLDSALLDEKKYENKFNFIFVDGNHQLDYVKSDTEKSFEMLSSQPACIAWHDFGNPEFPELTQYIRELSKTKMIFHIEETMLAFYVIGREVMPRLA